MTTAKPWSGEAVEAAFASQGLALAPGRGERLARGQQALLAASAADPVLRTLELQDDPTTFLLALRRTR